MIDPEGGLKLQLGVDGSRRNCSNRRNVNSVFGDYEDDTQSTWFEAKGKKKGKTKVGKFLKKVGKGAKKVVQKAKTLTLAPARGAMQALLRMNAFGMASDIKKIKDSASKGVKADKDRYDKIRNTWYKFGGNRTTFDKTIDLGSKVKAKKLKFGKKKGADGSDQYEIMVENQNFSVVGTAAAIASATPIIIAIIGAMGKKPSAMEDDGTLAELQNASKENEAQIAAALAEEAKLSPTEKSEIEKQEANLASEIQSELSSSNGEIKTSDLGKIASTPGAQKGGVPKWVWIAGGIAGVVLVTGVIVSIAKK